jgi:hypothetical protein
MAEPSEAGTPMGGNGASVPRGLKSGYGEVDVLDGVDLDACRRDPAARRRPAPARCSCAPSRPHSEAGGTIEMLGVDLGRASLADREAADKRLASCSSRAPSSPR